MAGQSSLLVVEEEPSQREAIARLFQGDRFDVFTAEDPEQALTYLDDPVDLVISEMGSGPNGNGLDLLQSWKQRRPSTPFIMLTACGDRESVIQAMKFGAEDSLGKPVNPEELVILVRKCLEARRNGSTATEAPVTSPPLSQEIERQGFENLVGNSPEMLRMYERARRAAQAESTVLVTGESGTGKELIAQGIHKNSPRKRGPLITVNIAAVPDTLVESELFGHVKGAFTGAAAERIGRFEAAHGGTLFVDEIGDLELNSQAKLLRVLENHVVTPVGGNHDQAVNVRVVAATSRDLEAMIAKGEFREDLYYRLNVVTLKLPALRQRRGDIPLLVEHFLEELCTKNNRPRPKIDAALAQFLENHTWPGNVRQLRNCIESMIVLANSDVLTLDDLPPTVHATPRKNVADTKFLQGKTLSELERLAINQALTDSRGNRTKAAEALGISIRTLQRKLRKWDSNSPDEDDDQDGD